ncbi:MAG: hypothetical protein OEV49_06500 [candidate division Zixibacteria bacterium]|nr:hypothetical protein [candidate division Zixibacteria bacterium]MDH3935872.1 hypothetical protein [candidate division Zixibacteria bacterium]
MQEKPKPKLRLGLLLDSFTIHTWQLRMLKKIVASEYAAFQLVLLNDAPTITPRKRSLYRLLGYMEAHLWRTYHGVSKDPSQPGWDPFELVDSSALLKAVPVLKVQPKQSRHSDRFTPEDIETIKSHEVDVLIRIGFRILRGDILKAARYGVWSYHMSDNRVIRGGPPGFWEVLESHPVTGSVLQVLSEELDDGVILYRSWSATHPFSIDRNRDNYYRKSISFLPRKLRELHNLGAEKFFEKVHGDNQTDNRGGGKLYKAPSNTRFLRLFARYLAKQVRVMLSRLLFCDQWVLLYSRTEQQPETLSEFKKLSPPGQKSWQDPCIVYEGGRHHVFVGEHGRKRSESHISLLSLDSSGSWQSAVTVLLQPHALSHPFVFTLENEHYMIASSSDGGPVELFRATDFPTKWTYENCLIQDITAANATMFHHESSWYLLANAIENEGSSINDELFLFYADHPLSTHWTPHPLNPIVSDVRKARPAGRIFNVDGNLYRPAQDNSAGDGQGVRIFQIVILSESRYEEQEVRGIAAEGHSEIKSIGAFAGADGLTVVGGRVKKMRLF